MRVAIAGPPRSGKTTLARELSDEPLSTDDLISMGWSKGSETAAEWFGGNDDIVIEGVTVPRALRKWLVLNPTGRPVDEVRYLPRSRERLTTGQRIMGKGVKTVLKEIKPELLRRGVRVVGI